jgi:hypothetical protein
MPDGNSADADARTEPSPLVYTREDGESPSESVISAVSEATGTHPLRLPRLGDVLDPDALDALFLADAPGADERSGTAAGTVAFRFGGREVTVHADGRTVVAGPPATQS